MYLGLDPTASAERASGFALLDERGHLLRVGGIASDEEIIALAASSQPGIVAIDAPLFYPRGWHCLEWPCPQGLCPPPKPGTLRSAERELYRQGIGVYATTKRSLIKAIVYRAIAVKAALERLGVTVIEVYPYASKVRLFGKAIPKKSTPEGRRWLQDRLKAHVPGLARWPSPLSHDAQDAVVAAYTAYLYDQRRAEAIGDAEEGVIVVARGSQHRLRR